MSRIKEKSNMIKILDVKMKVDENCISVDINKRLLFDDEDIKEEFLELTNKYLEELNILLIKN